MVGTRVIRKARREHINDANSPLIAVLLDHIESDYHIELLDSAMRAAQRRGARLVIVPGGALNQAGGPGRQRGYIYDFLNVSDVDALILLGGSLSNYSGIAGFEHFFDTLPELPSVVLGLDTPAAPCIAVNNEHGISLLFNHLVFEHHARKIAFIQGPAGSTEAYIRKQAYIASVERHQLKLDSRYMLPGGLGREQGIDAIVTLLDDRHMSPKDVDAIVCVNDDVALGALEELARRGIRVPEDIAVVGFDDTPAAHTATPALTTISQRVYEQAESAINQVLDKIEQKLPANAAASAATAPSARGRTELLPDFIKRASCGCRPAMLSDSSPQQALSKTQPLAAVHHELCSKLLENAHGRLFSSPGWEVLLVDSLLAEYEGQYGAFVSRMAALCRDSGETGIDTCHDILTQLRRQVLQTLDDDDAKRLHLEDTFQEARLAISNHSLFSVRERHATQALHLRVITRACLHTALGSDLDELAVALDEQLPMIGIENFVVSKGSGDVLRVVARSSGRRHGEELVTTAGLGRDQSLAEAQCVVVLPLSAAEGQVGLAAFNYGKTDPFLFEQLRDLLGHALSADISHSLSESGYHPAIQG